MRAIHLLLLLFVSVFFVNAFFGMEPAPSDAWEIQDNIINAIRKAARDPRLMYTLDYLMPLWGAREYQWSQYDPRVVQRTLETLPYVNFTRTYSDFRGGYIYSRVAIQFRDYPLQWHEFHVKSNSSSPTGYIIRKYEVTIQDRMHSVKYKCDLFCVSNYIFGVKPMPTRNTFYIN